MSHLYESIVQEYICANKQRFINTQFYLSWKDEQGGGQSEPDFLVLDFQKEKIYVVEVTTSASVSALVEKGMSRERRWFGPIRESVMMRTAPMSGWKLHATLVVRDDCQKAAAAKFADQSDISVLSIEKLGTPWTWFDTAKDGVITPLE